MQVVNYKAFFQNNYYLRTKFGELVPFALNDVQDAYNTVLLTDYPTMQGIREIDLKGRQFGISTYISGIFTTDFILSALGKIPFTAGDIYSHKDKETRAHFNRVNMFLNSWLLKDRGGDYRNPEHRRAIPALRKAFLKTDSDAGLLVSKNGTPLSTATAGAKVSGRGDTKQNIHWSEPAFYPNTPILSAENLITGAEEQVPTGYGKIFRESTGNLAADFYAKEYKLAKDGHSEFKARFLAWYSHAPYAIEAPSDWSAHPYYERLLREGLATVEQCYWHFQKTRGLTNKKRLREYPTYDTEAFLFGGQPFFDADALLWYMNRVQKPQKEVLYVPAL